MRMRLRSGTVVIAKFVGRAPEFFIEIVEELLFGFVHPALNSY